MAKKINKNNTQPKVYEDTGLAEIFLKQEIETPITEVPNIDKPTTKKNKNHTNKIKTLCPSFYSLFLFSVEIFDGKSLT